MELAIIHNNQVFTAVEHLDEYDLDKPYARVELMDAIRHEVARILKYEID